MRETTPEDKHGLHGGLSPSGPSREEPTDSALVARVARRDPEAFDLLVLRYQERAYRLAWHLTRDREEARDLSQEAFVKVYRAAGSFKGEAKFSTWFFRILMNLCLDYKRKTARWRRFFTWEGSEQGTGGVEGAEAPTDDVVETLDREAAMARLWAAVDRLSPKQRAAVLLQVQEGLSTREIAEVLKLRESTVRVHLHRALNGLRAHVTRAS